MSATTIAVLREVHPNEHRVALSPEQVASLCDLGCVVRVESGAGVRVHWSDAAYADVGAEVEQARSALLDRVDCVVKVRPPTTGLDALPDEVTELPQGCVLVSFLSPGEPVGLVEALARRRVSAIAMERIPRTTRAQRMDALSSQSTASGYRAVLLAAMHLPRFFPMLTTAAGTIRPATVTVLGAGVAGLQAIATARRLGASVQGYDIRPAAAEQVRSLGAVFLEEEVSVADEAEAEGGYARALKEAESSRQLAFLGHHLPRADAIITTAQIPGRPAPLLVTRETVEAMKPGSVVVDLAGESGGNCELSRPDEMVVHNGVTILAPTDLAAGVGQDASRMFGTNVLALLKHIMHDGQLVLDLEDEILDAVLVTHGGDNRKDTGGR